MCNGVRVRSGLFNCLLSQYSLYMYVMQDVVRNIEKVETGSNNRPVEDVVISDCGVIPVEEPFAAEK